MFQAALSSSAPLEIRRAEPPPHPPPPPTTIDMNYFRRLFRMDLPPADRLWEIVQKVFSSLSLSLTQPSDPNLSLTYP